MKKLSTIVMVSAMMMAPQAYASDALIEGAKLCTRQLPHFEREYGVPTHLLSAIASTESGRYHEGLKIKVPWPWTINAAGKGYYYDSKLEAVAAAKQFRARGIQSFDVGCMQVNMMHHPNAFASLEEAFEPKNNVAYAASFLRTLYEGNNHSWKQAAADYHSKTPSRGTEYAGLVYNSWYNIIDKLRAAKLQVPDSSVVAMNAMKTEPLTARPDKLKTIKVASNSRVRPLPDQVGKKVAAYQSPKMNSIKVTKQASLRENGVIVVRPEIKVVDAPADVITTVSTVEPVSAITLADMKPAAGHADAKVIQVSGEKKPGPNFIFND